MSSAGRRTAPLERPHRRSSPAEATPRHRARRDFCGRPSYYGCSGASLPRPGSDRGTQTRGDRGRPSSHAVCTCVSSRRTTRTRSGPARLPPPLPRRLRPRRPRGRRHGRDRHRRRPPRHREPLRLGRRHRRPLRLRLRQRGLHEEALLEELGGRLRHRQGEARRGRPQRRRQARRPRALRQRVRRERPVRVPLHRHQLREDDGLERHADLEPREARDRRRQRRRRRRRLRPLPHRHRHRGRPRLPHRRLGDHGLRGQQGHHDEEGRLAVGRLRVGQGEDLVDRRRRRRPRGPREPVSQHADHARVSTSSSPPARR